MSRRYPFAPDGEGPWTEWIRPPASGFKFRCCDCSLVHVLQFVAVAASGRQRKGQREYRPIKGDVVFRVRRDDRATAACRRNAKQL